MTVIRSTVLVPSVEQARAAVYESIDRIGKESRALNRSIHDHPELGYQEIFAHKTLTDFLETQGFKVTRHAYGLETSFEAEIGSGGRLVIFCAEYDALPGIGHGCGHNLIATSSIAAFIGLAKARQKLGIPGRVRILGTPAEEGGGGKIKLIEAGAFKDGPAAAIMCHPTVDMYDGKYSGVGGWKLMVSYKMLVEFRGKAAHAASEPWSGVNALDAAVAAYSNISLMRQQIQPDERIHSVIEDGGKVPNVIPEYTRLNVNARSPTLERAAKLIPRVKSCFDAAAISTGCKVNYIHTPTYKDLRVNETLCQAYVENMADLGEKILLKDDNTFMASTDMGNVSYAVPSFHGAFAIPAPKGTVGHHSSFTTAAATDEAHEAAIICSKALAMLGWRVLVDEKLAEGARRDFENS